MKTRAISLNVFATAVVAASLNAQPVVTTLDPYLTQLSPELEITGVGSASQFTAAPVGAIGDRLVTLDSLAVDVGFPSVDLQVKSTSAGAVLVNSSIDVKQQFSVEYTNLVTGDFANGGNNAFGIRLFSADIGTGADPDWDLLISVQDSNSIASSLSIGFSGADKGDFFIIPFGGFSGINFTDVQSVKWSVAPGDSTDPFSKDIILGEMQLGVFTDDTFTLVPEPSTYALVSLLVLGPIFIARRRLKVA